MKTRTVVITLLLCVAVIGVASAVPPLPAEFYGDVTIDGDPAPAGTVITALIDGEERGTITTTDAGTYGGFETFEPRLVVQGNDDDLGQTIAFQINGNDADQTSTFQPGESQKLDLSVAGSAGDGEDGGGTSGGGGPTLTEAVKSASLLTTTAGLVLQSVSLTSSDVIATLTLSQGITARDASGNALASISIERVTSTALPAIPNGALYSFAGYAYRCVPDGATFDPSITLSFTIPVEVWEELASESLVIKWYNPETGSWEDLQTTVNADARRVSVQISHFSIFALFTETAQPAEQPTLQPTPTATPRGSPTPSSTTEVPPLPAEIPWMTMIIAGGIIVIAIVGGVSFWRFGRKR